MVTNCPYAESTNEWKKSNNIWNNGTCGNTMVKPQTLEYRLINKHRHFVYQNLKNSILKYFTRYLCIAVHKDSWISIHEWFGGNFPTLNIRNVWRAPDDRHLYDVTTKCCGVTIATCLVERTLFISEMNVFFCSFQELSGLKIQMVTQIKCAIKGKRHGRSVLRK